MHNRSPMVIIILVPLYVFFTFASTAIAPVLQGMLGKDDPPQVRPIHLTFVGDIMFDRYIREQAEINGYASIFENVRTTLPQDVYLFGNLEGPITTFTPVAHYLDPGPDHYRFTFATSVATTLHDEGFRAVSLANNHVNNFGPEGMQQTTEWLDHAGVGHTGIQSDPYTPWRMATSGHEIVVYAYDPWHANDIDELTLRIQSEASSTFVVMLAHWGEEYETVQNEAQIALAHTLVDAGVDFIAGSHPHVIQEKESYNNVWIYYSLGNFVFDQYFSKQVRCGATVTLTIEPDRSYTTEEAFVELARDGTTIASDCRTEIDTRIDA